MIEFNRNASQFNIRVINTLHLHLTLFYGYVFKAFLQSSKSSPMILLQNRLISNYMRCESNINFKNHLKEALTRKISKYLLRFKKILAFVLIALQVNDYLDKYIYIEFLSDSGLKINILGLIMIC